MTSGCEYCGCGYTGKSVESGKCQNCGAPVDPSAKAPLSVAEAHAMAMERAVRGYGLLAYEGRGK